MKRLSILFAAAGMALLCASCLQETAPLEVEPVAGTTELVAMAEQAGVSTRSTLSGTAVLWQKGDCINVMDIGSHNDGSYSLVDGAGTTVGTFRGGDIQPAMQYYALYPYMDGMTKFNSRYGFCIPQEQTWRKDSFGQGANVMVATFTDPTEPLHFRNVLGLLKLSLTGTTSVHKISVSDADPEHMLWGKAKLLLDGKQGTSEQTLELTEGDNTVHLLCPSGAQLSETPTLFYIALPQGALSSGMTVRVYAENNLLLDEFSTGKNNAIIRSEVRAMPARTVVSDISRIEPANSYILYKPGLYKLKAVKGNSSETLTGAHDAVLLWEGSNSATAPVQNSIISDVSYSNGYVYFTLGTGIGNAAIAVRDADKNILWSWHIWVPETEVQALQRTSDYLMDRNLGASSANSSDGAGTIGLLYEWGRKDPFPGSAAYSGTSAMGTVGESFTSSERNSSTGTIAYATAHPQEYLFCTTGSDPDQDWLYTHSEIALWAADKTIYDPCPPGWHVAGRNDWWNNTASFVTGNPCGANVQYNGDNTSWFPAGGHRYAKDGTIHDRGILSYYWAYDMYTANGSNKAYSTRVKTDATNGSNIGLYGMGRAAGFNVRCVASSLPEPSVEPLPGGGDFDIYLCIGQSNMAGLGPMIEGDDEPIEGVWVLNASGVPEVATNPLNRFSTVGWGNQQISPAYGFCTSLYEKTGRPILLVMQARGGSSLSQWAVGQWLFNEAVSRTRIALRYGTLKGILWHQGEANSNTYRTYMSNLKTIVSALREQIGAGNVPFVAGELQHDHVNAGEFNNMLHGISEEIPCSGWVSSYGVTLIEDNLHHDRASQIMLGGRYADAIYEMVYAEPKASSYSQEEMFPYLYPLTKQLTIGGVSGSKYVVDIITNQGEVSASIPAAASSWLQATPEEGKVTFRTQADNTGLSTRSAVVTLTAGTESRTVSITQGMKPKYPIGSAWGNDGVVFWSNPENPDQVKIISAGAELRPWGPAGVTIQPQNVNTDALTGPEAAERIRNSADYESADYALKYCDGLGEGWYLPTLAEADELFFAYDGETYSGFFQSGSATKAVPANCTAEEQAHRAAFDAALTSIPGGIALNTAAPSSVGDRLWLCKETSNGYGYFYRYGYPVYSALAKNDNSTYARCVKVVHTPGPEETVKDFLSGLPAGTKVSGISATAGGTKVEFSNDTEITLDDSVFSQDTAVADGYWHVDGTTTGVAANPGNYLLHLPRKVVFQFADGTRRSFDKDIDWGMVVQKTADKLFVWMGHESSNQWIRHTLNYRNKAYNGGTTYPDYYDNWGLGKPCVCTWNGGTSFATGQELFLGGEAEAAVQTDDEREPSQRTYSGGVLHGWENIYEVENNRQISILVDGVAVGETATLSRRTASRVEIVQKTKIARAYSLEGLENAYADIVKHWVIEDGTVTISVEYTFLAQTQVYQGKFGMFCVKRLEEAGNTGSTYITRLAWKDSTPQTMYEVTEGWESAVSASAPLKSRDNSARRVEEYGDAGVAFAMQFDEGTLKSGGGFNIGTNGNNYNKIYFDICGNYTAAQDEKLSSTVHWELDLVDDFGKF